MANCGRVRCKGKQSCKCNYQEARRIKMEIRDKDNCWYLDGNKEDGYKVIRADGTVLASMDNSVSIRDLATIRLIIAEHNQMETVQQN